MRRTASEVHSALPALPAVHVRGRGEPLDQVGLLALLGEPQPYTLLLEPLVRLTAQPHLLQERRAPRHRDTNRDLRRVSCPREVCRRRRLSLGCVLHPMNE